jgi:hypothetical protein
MQWKYYVFLYKNRKMRHVETVPGMGGERINRNDGRMNLTT